MAKKEDKPDGLTEEEFGQFSLIKAQNEMVVKRHPRVLTWSDLENYTTELQEFPVVYADGHMFIKYKELKGGEYNQIVEEVSRMPGIRDNPIEFERIKQDHILRRMVVFIGDRKMQTDDGTAIESSWLKVISPIYEQLRVGFFRTTGEIKQNIEDEVGMNVDQIIKMLKAVKENGTNGLFSKDEVELKK